MDDKTATQDPETEAKPDVTAQPPAEAKNTEEQSIPLSRFKEVNAAKKSLEEKLAQLEAAEAERQKAADKAKRDADLEQGKFKELHEKAEADLAALRPKAEKADAYEKAFNDLLTARLEKVPEHIKTLLAVMNPLDAMKWLDANADALQPRQAPDTGAGKQGEREKPSTKVVLPQRKW